MDRRIRNKAFLILTLLILFFGVIVSGATQTIIKDSGTSYFLSNIDVGGNDLFNLSDVNTTKVNTSSIKLSGVTIATWDDVNKTFVDTFVTSANITGWGYFLSEANLTALLNDNYFLSEANLTALLNDLYYRSEANLTGLLNNNYVANDTNVNFSRVNATSYCIGALCLSSWDEVNSTIVDTYVTTTNITGWGYFLSEANLTNLLNDNYFLSEANLTTLLNDNYLANGSSAIFKKVNLTHLNISGTVYGDSGNIEFANHIDLQGRTLVDASIVETNAIRDPDDNTLLNNDNLYNQGNISIRMASTKYQLGVNGSANISDTLYLGNVGVSNWDMVNGTDVDTYVTTTNITGWGYFLSEANLTSLLNDNYYMSEANLTAVLNDEYVNKSGDSLTGNFTMADNLTIESLRFEGNTSHRIYNNGTCIIFDVGSTSFEVCE